MSRVRACDGCNRLKSSQGVSDRDKWKTIRFSQLTAEPRTIDVCVLCQYDILGFLDANREARIIRTQEEERLNA